MYPTSARTQAEHRSLADEFARWLFDYIDEFDYGFPHPTEARPHRFTSRRLARFVAGKADVPPLSVEQIEAHLSGDARAKRYYTSRCGSEHVFAMIDVDAHDGQDDAPQAAALIASNFFPGAYVEPSRRGVHIHPLVGIGKRPGSECNELLRRLQTDLRALLCHHGFKSTVEVTGGFTDWALLPRAGSRFQMGAVPRLANGFADLDRLRCAPVFLVAALDHVHEQALALLAPSLASVPNTPSHPSLPEVCVSSTKVLPRPDSDSAWERMMRACFDFTVLRHRLPTEDELLAYYENVYQAGTTDAARRRRARDAIRYRANTFDPKKATERGYEHVKGELLSAVRTFCKDRTHKYRGTVTDEDLAIGLYVVTRNSFQDRRDPRVQWTNPYECFQRMCEALRKAGETRRGFGKRNKVAAIKLILERAGLIWCEDRRYVAGGGIGQKYTIGPNHWRYAEFLRFRGGVSVHHLSPRADRAGAAAIVLYPDGIPTTVAFPQEVYP